MVQHASGLARLVLMLLLVGPYLADIHTPDLPSGLDHAPLAQPAPCVSPPSKDAWPGSNPKAASAASDTDGPVYLSSLTITTSIFLPVIVRSLPQEIHVGEGTFYGATGAGNCMFDPSPDNLMVAAMNHTDYAHAALCGAYVAIQGPKGTVTVRIVDRCPECAPGDIDLSREAFAVIADLAAGRVPIRWWIVSPDIPGPIVYRFMEGSSQYWTAVQIRNHRNPVAGVAYRLPSGNFQVVPRTDYNYFVAAQGMGPGPFTFRVTDIYGHVLIDRDVLLVAGSEVPGNAQFPPPP